MSVDVKGDSQVSWLIVAVVAGAVLGHVMATQTIPSMELFGQIAAGCIGAFVGAFAAFRLEGARRRQEDEEKFAREGHRILFELTLMYSEILRYGQQAFNNVVPSQPELDWLKVSAKMRVPMREGMLSTKGLEFMLADERGRFLLGQVALNRERLYQLMWSIEQHCNRREEAIARVEAAGLASGPFDHEKWKHAVGPSLHKTLESLASRLRRHSERDRKDCACLYVSLTEWFRQRFPDKNFVGTGNDAILRDAEQGELPVLSH